jgi:hypothetical protein
MTEQNLHDYNKWLTEVWSKQHSNIPFMQDAPNAYLKYLSEQLIIADVVKRSEPFKCRNVACNKMVERNSGTVFCKKHRNL